MNKTTEALNLAEEALDMVVSCGYGSKTRERVEYRKALAAIREALAEQEERMVGVEKFEPVKQEPVGYV